ncbi:MAG: hypothetical protein AAFY45_32150 [Bacteroidota bacterium]
MKYFLYLSFCLLYFPVFAQQDSNAVEQNKRLKERSAQPMSFEEKISKTETELNLAIQLFGETKEKDRKLIEAQCKSYLFQLFDLNIEKRENQIIQLEEELEKISKRDQNIDKFNDLIEIKEEIDLVQNEIYRRKKNRDMIVEKRLKEILYP